MRPISFHRPGIQPNSEACGNENSNDQQHHEGGHKTGDLDGNPSTHHDGSKNKTSSGGGDAATSASQSDSNHTEPSSTEEQEEQQLSRLQQQQEVVVDFPPSVRVGERVSFSTVVEAVLIPSNDDLTDSDKHEIWYQHQDYADFRRDYNRFQRTPSRDDDPDWEDFSNTTAATAIPAADIVPPMVFPNSHNNSNDNDHGLPATPTAGAVLVVTGATSVDTSGSWVVANNDNTVPQQALHQKEQQRRSGRGSPRKARGGGSSWTGDNKVSPSAAKTMQDRNDKNKMSGRRGGGAGGVVHEKGYPAYDANNSQQRQTARPRGRNNKGQQRQPRRHANEDGRASGFNSPAAYSYANAATHQKRQGQQQQQQQQQAGRGNRAAPTVWGNNSENLLNNHQPRALKINDRINYNNNNNNNNYNHIHNQQQQQHQQHHHQQHQQHQHQQHHHPRHQDECQRFGGGKAHVSGVPHAFQQYAMNLGHFQQQQHGLRAPGPAQRPPSRIAQELERFVVAAPPPRVFYLWRGPVMFPASPGLMQ